MSVLILAQIDVDDPKELLPYQELAMPAMKEFGIRLVGKTSAAEVLEGKPAGTVNVILQAESEQQARDWHASPSYAKAIAARGAARFTMLLVPSAAQG